MPWELDYALLTFTQLKKSKYHLPDDVEITINTALNLSSYIINWEESKIPKEYFIEKYNTLSILLSDYKHNSKIYDEDKLYGFFDLHRASINKETDYYIHLCPDIYFSEYVLTYMVEAARQITSKYFIITPQTSKVGDSDWDKITNPKYIDIPYKEYEKADTFSIRYDTKTSTDTVELKLLDKSKFAGWFDLYNKAFYEELVPLQDEWVGYGPWDYYSMIIVDFVKNYGVDFQQYLLQGETIWYYASGPLKGNNIDGFIQYYKNMLILTTDKHNQRKEFEAKLPEYINKGIEFLKLKNIIPKNVFIKFQP
jgi:hypothetical protein